MAGNALPQSRAGGRRAGPYLRSLEHLGRSEIFEGKTARNIIKSKMGRTDGRMDGAGCRVATINKINYLNRSIFAPFLSPSIKMKEYQQLQASAKKEKKLPILKEETAAIMQEVEAVRAEKLKFLLECDDYER